jgi:6-phospho-3-hexuloisomerase
LEVLREFDNSENKSKLLNSFLNRIIDTKNTGSKIFIYGVGRSGYVGKSFAMRLMHLGFNVHFIGETTCPAIEDKDVLIAISGSGETYLTVNVLKKAKELMKLQGYDITIVSITCKTENSIKELSNIHINLNICNSEYFPMGTLFEEIALIFLDMNIYLLMNKLGISEAEMKKRHCNLQ